VRPQTRPWIILSSIVCETCTPILCARARQSPDQNPKTVEVQIEAKLHGVPEEVRVAAEKVRAQKPKMIAGGTVVIGNVTAAIEDGVVAPTVEEGAEVHRVDRTNMTKVAHKRLATEAEVMREVETKVGREVEIEIEEGNKCPLAP